MNTQNHTHSWGPTMRKKTTSTSYKTTNTWENALCTKYDPEMWAITGRVITPQNRTAMAICAQCPIRAYCRSQKPKIRPNSMILAGIPYGTEGEPWLLTGKQPTTQIHSNP